MVSQDQMNIDTMKNKKEKIAIVLLAVSTISALVIVVKVTGFFVTSASAEDAVKQAIEQGKPDAKHLTAQLGRFKQVQERWGRMSDEQRRQTLENAKREMH